MRRLCLLSYGKRPCMATARSPPSISSALHCTAPSARAAPQWAQDLDDPSYQARAAAAVVLNRRHAGAQSRHRPAARPCSTGCADAAQPALPTQPQLCPSPPRCAQVASRLSDPPNPLPPPSGAATDRDTLLLNGGYQPWFSMKVG